MVAATFGVLRAAVGYKVAHGWIGLSAVFADEWTMRIALEGFVVPSIRVVHAAVSHKRAEFRPFLPAVDADERSILVTLEEDMLAPSVRVKGAGIVQQVSGVRILPSAVFAQFAHGGPLQCCVPFIAISYIRLSG